MTTRLALACAVTMPVLALVAGFGVLRLAREDVHRELDSYLRARAADVRPQAVVVLGDPGARDRLEAMAVGGGVVVGSPTGRWEAGALPPDTSLPTRLGPFTVRDGRTDWRGYASRLDTGGGAQTGWLWVFAGPDQAEQRLQTLRRRLGGVALLTVPVAAGLGWLGGRAAARPLTRLRQRLRHLGPAPGATQRVDLRSGVPEVDEVASVIDVTLDRYDQQVLRTAQALDAARSFAAAAAHELRTPLSGLGTNLEVLARHPDLGPEQRREILDDLLTEHGRMTGLLGMLRALADGGLAGPENFALVDLVELAEDCGAAVRAEHPDTTITVSGPAELSVLGYEDGLRSMMINLLRNAATHGRDPDTGRSEITVELAEVSGRPDSACLTVTDRGPGVAPDDRARILQRFWRGATSRGSGLGLALVAQQVSLHGGELTVLEGPNRRGARFAVSLPSRPCTSTGTNE